MLLLNTYLCIAYRAVHVGLEAPDETKATLYLSYVVTNASWSSAYDVRVFSKDKLMKVCVHAPVRVSCHCV